MTQRLLIPLLFALLSGTALSAQVMAAEVWGAWELVKLEQNGQALDSEEIGSILRLNIDGSLIETGEGVVRREKRYEVRENQLVVQPGTYAEERYRIAKVRKNKLVLAVSQDGQSAAMYFKRHRGK